VLASAALAALAVHPPPRNTMLRPRPPADYRQRPPMSRRAPSRRAELNSGRPMPLALAEGALARRRPDGAGRPAPYLARQRVALAREAADRKASERWSPSHRCARPHALAARTREADDATQAAASARRDARVASSSRHGHSSRPPWAQQQAAHRGRQAGDAERRSQALEAHCASSMRRRPTAASSSTSATCCSTPTGPS